MSPYEIKKEICEIGRRIYNDGFVAANDGNISVKVNDNEFYFKKTNTNDAYVELFPSGNFSQVKNFVIDFEYDPVKIDTDLRIFRANTENSSYKFLGISSNGNLNAGEISVPVLEKTKITLCVDL